MAPCLHFLRPYASLPLSTRTLANRSAYLLFYELARQHGNVTCRRTKSTAASAVEPDADKYKPESRGALVAARVEELRKRGALSYPRVEYTNRQTTIKEFKAKFENMTTMQLEKYRPVVTLSGRIKDVRRHGRLFFLNLIHDGVKTQALVNLGKLEDGTDKSRFNKLASLIRRGDHVSIKGRPMRSLSDQLSIEAIRLPDLVSPCLTPLPYRLPSGAKMQQRHMDLLVDPTAAEKLRVRSHVISTLRAQLQDVLGCIEVQTPILAANAGGAMARPFTTHATEFSEKQLALRIAPELWLKRLVVGGFDRVYEIGPSFRNEGLDLTHNPEFTMCEFYLANTNLEHLMSITKDIVQVIAKRVNSFVSQYAMSLKAPQPKIFEQYNFAQLEFIPAVEKALGHPLPNLDSPTAVRDIIKLLEDRGNNWHKTLPPNPSLPKLLDAIAAAALEPASEGKPLFIVHHPVCMSPLAKSFSCPTTGQLVSARAELFFDGNELANMYEEENDPFAQKRKFVEQAKLRLAQQGGQPVADDEEEPPHVIDEQYISVLESGLPPTGGWGCGVDRLVMLFTGSKRISDVLPFGNLRNVTGLASAGQQNQVLLPAETEGKEKPAETINAKPGPQRKQPMVIEPELASQVKQTWENQSADKMEAGDVFKPELFASGFKAFSAASFLEMSKEKKVLLEASDAGAGKDVSTTSADTHVPQNSEVVRKPDEADISSKVDEQQTRLVGGTPKAPIFEQGGESSPELELEHTAGPEEFAEQNVSGEAEIDNASEEGASAENANRVDGVASIEAKDDYLQPEEEQGEGALTKDSEVSPSKVGGDGESTTAEADNAGKASKDS